MTKTKTLTALARRRDTWNRSCRRSPTGRSPLLGGGWGGGAVAAGVIGGLAAGAIIGSAAGYGPYYGGYGPGYYAYAPGPAYYGGCYLTRQRIWDGWGWRVRRVRVCN
jgi:hypothetical protein